MGVRTIGKQQRPLEPAANHGDEKVSPELQHQVPACNQGPLAKLVFALVIVVSGGLLAVGDAKAQLGPNAFWKTRHLVTVVLTSGSSWTVPVGVTSLDSVECWGGGGGAAG